MESFRRKYWHIIKEDKPRALWKHFDKMGAIIEYQEDPKEPDRPEESSDGTFSSVYVDEVTPILFNEEESSQNEDDDVKTISSSTMSTDATFPKKAKRRLRRENYMNPSDSAGTQEKTKQRRRFWVLHEEQIFLDVWEKYVQDLRGNRKKAHVYRDMELEFRNQGIEIKGSDVKAKIESFTRKFRKERDSLGTDSEWIHYAKVAELLGVLEVTKFDHYSDNSASSYYADDSCLWFNENLPLYPLTCLKYDSSSIECLDMEQPSKKAKSSPSDAQDECYISEPNKLELKEQPIEPYEITCRPQLTEQFGRFVTKELNTLNDDLLIEAKRKIYNIICIMQMKQMQLNNTTN